MPRAGGGPTSYCDRWKSISWERVVPSQFPWDRPRASVWPALWSRIPGCCWRMSLRRPPDADSANLVASALADFVAAGGAAVIASHDADLEAMLSQKVAGCIPCRRWGCRDEHDLALDRPFLAARPGSLRLRLPCARWGLPARLVSYGCNRRSSARNGGRRKVLTSWLGPGSALQNVLAAVYYLDVPNGAFVSTKSALRAIQWLRKPSQWAMGDSVAGARIVGAGPDFLAFNGAELAEGALPGHRWRLIVGSSLAARAKAACRRHFRWRTAWVVVTRRPSTISTPIG